MNSIHRVLLTGFGTYGRYAANSSEQAVKAILSRRLPNTWIQYEIYPATIPHYDRGLRILELAECKSDYVVCLGMASDRTSFSIETRMRNAIDNKHYCPDESDTPVAPELPFGSEFAADLTQWNIDAFIQECVNANLPRPQWSQDAGGFCCNHLMMQLLRAQCERPYLRCISWIFLHVPCSEEAVRPEDIAAFEKAGKVRMKIEDIVKCLEIFLKTALPAQKEDPAEVS